MTEKERTAILSESEHFDAYVDSGQFEKDGGIQNYSQGFRDAWNGLHHKETHIINSNTSRHGGHSPNPTNPKQTVTKQRANERKTIYSQKRSAYT